jgi:ribosomal protein L11 methyltransferase
VTLDVAVHCLEIRCAPELRPRAADLLTELGCLAFDERPEGPIVAYAETDAALSSFATAIERHFDGAVAARLVPLASDWKLAFARSLEPLELTRTLWVEPRGSVGAPSNARKLVLEPAFAFGFGEHTTTRLLARWLERALVARPSAGVLDFGCGTGILSLSAVAFGASHVVGLDIDPEAIRAARSNATLNDAVAQCEFSCDDVVARDRDFELVVANVDVQTLVAHAPDLVTRMSRKALIAFTGFLAETAGEVVETLDRHGVVSEVVETDDGWALVSNWLRPQ